VHVGTSYNITIGTIYCKYTIKITGYVGHFAFICTCIILTVDHPKYTKFGLTTMASPKNIKYLNIKSYFTCVQTKDEGRRYSPMAHLGHIRAYN